MRLGPDDETPDLTLGYEVALWIEDNCAIPDGDRAGEPFVLTDEQLRFVLWWYALNPDGSFRFRRSLLVRPQKWGKGPLSAAIICAEAAGPVVFDGFDQGGLPKGRPWATPWIQVVAVSEDQTDNVWTALVPMIELGNLSAEVPDTGKTRINLTGPTGAKGLIEPVTSAAISRLGQRLTFALHDETHSWTDHNGGSKLADTQRRNLGGMGGRSLETTNAWDPAEDSVAQHTFEVNLPDVLVDYPEPRAGSIRNHRERKRVLKHAYAGAPWVDLDRIDSEIEELVGRDPGQAERFFLNRIVAGADRAFDVKVFKSLGNGERIPNGRKVTLGFDGARHHDATGIVATDIGSGHQQVVAVWERPADVPEDEWEVPSVEVHDAVAEAFDIWDVWRIYADPPYWQTEIDEWAGRYGAERVVKWWTNRLKSMAFAIESWQTDFMDGKLSHDGNEVLVRHVGHAVKRPTRMRDDNGAFLWVISKDGQKSPRKIDLVMAAILSWKGRSDAISDGVMNKPTYRVASW